MTGQSVFGWTRLAVATAVTLALLSVAALIFAPLTGVGKG